MALGDTNSKSSGKVYENTFYSRIRFRNQDKLSLAFQFRSGLLVVAISEEKDGFQYEEKTKISLSPNKARILRDQLIEFRNQVIAGGADPNKAYGVNAGLKETVSFLAFHATDEVSPSGIQGYAVTIGKVDGAGKVSDIFDFVFNLDYHYGLIWDNLKNMEFEKEVKDLLELDVFIAVLDEFIGTASGATGYSVFDIGRYEIHRIINPVYEKLGIERGKSSGSSGNGTNYFNNSNTGSRSTSRSVEDIEDMM